MVGRRRWAGRGGVGGGRELVDDRESLPGVHILPIRALGFHDEKIAAGGGVADVPPVLIRRRSINKRRVSSDLSLMNQLARGVVHANLEARGVLNLRVKGDRRKAARRIRV